MRVLVSPAPAAAFLPRNLGPRAPPLLIRHHRAVAAAGDNWGADQQPYRGGAAGRGRAGPSVQCDVDVVSWRERRVFASVAVAADVDTVWRIITVYERLADFVPNLVRPQCADPMPACPHEGRIWLEQALYWHIEARVVLDVREAPGCRTSKCSP